MSVSVLFVASEAYPLIKTGGLADVAGALPRALAKAGVDVCLMMPAYEQVLDLAKYKRKGRFMGHPFGIGEVSLINARMPDSGLRLMLVDCPPLFRRDGGPYQRPNGEDWPDNHARFALLSQIAARVANPKEGGKWHPDILHLNDWQTGLAAAYLHYYGISGVKSVFTIHNMRYQGFYGTDILPVIALPEEATGVDGIEYYGGISYMKAGINFSDIVTTVSRTYAKEIQTQEYGYGMEGLLQKRSDDLYGIVNGIDYDIWNPATDKLLKENYSQEKMAGKAACKKELQLEMGLPVDEKAPLFGFVGRLTEQKGADLIVDNLHRIMELGAQIVFLGTGDAHLEHLLGQASAHSERVAARLTYDENMAHRIIAGSDMFLMPSRFEPCGLTQMYALRYGTIPIVRRTGGLNDTVTSIEKDTTGNGFLFDSADPVALFEAIKFSVLVYEDEKLWQKVQSNAMKKDFSWDRAAKEYIKLYNKLKEGVV